MAIYTSKIKTQRGIGLIEVLIAAVVVGVGLLALGSLQGSLMSASGDNKARAEAIKLAEAKLEEYRNNIIKGNYDAVVSSAANESIAGSNETFSRGWVVANATAPNRKNISVQVTWGAAGAEETINMVNELVWADPGKATDYSTDGNGLSARAPSPNNNSSTKPTKQFDTDQITGETPLDDGSNILKYNDGEGHIYLLDSTGKVLIQFNGGVIHTIKGNVWSGNVGNGNNPIKSLSPLTSYPVTFSDLAYCVFPVTSGKSDYICYFGGDCNHGGDGCATIDGPSPYNAVNGGWYGKVGLIETAGDDFQNKKVCFAEDIASNVALTAAATSRLYSTQRLNASNVAVGSEGVNQSFACQDFLVVGAHGNSNDCHYFQNFNGLSVPSSAMHRSLGPNDSNVSLAENVSSCGNVVTYTITGGISGDQANLVSVFVNGNSCTSTVANNAYSYSCNITTVNTATSLTITATGGDVTPDSTALTLSTSQLSITGPTLIANSLSPEPTVYHITGTISGDLANQVNLSVSGGTCTKTLNVSSYSYDCAITSTPTSVTVNASGGNVTLANGSIATVSLADIATVAGPNFVAATPTSITYTITGTITGSQANSVTFTISNGGSCTNNALTSGTYTCTITSQPATATINATGGNVNPTSTSVTLAGVATVTGPVFNADNLASCTVVVTGNINKGAGNTKDPSHGTVTVSYSNSSPSGTGSCTKSNASGIYTYSCNVGSVNNSGQVTISGNKVTIGTPNPVPVSCTSNSLILTGPILTTTN